jgi:hypothetical protein
MKTLLELIRQRRAELEAKDLEGITDEMRINVLCDVITATRHNPRDPEAEKLRRFCEDPECRALVEKLLSTDLAKGRLGRRDIPRETGPEAPDEPSRGMAPYPRGPRDDAEHPAPASAGAEQPPREAARGLWAVRDDEPPAATIFDAEASARLSAPVPSHLQPIPSGRNQSWHEEKPDPLNPGTGWMERRR